MVHSKAIKVLRTFSPYEFKQFGKLVNSPFFNHNKNLSKLYTFLKKHYPEFEFTNEQAFKYLYPGKKYYDSKVRQLFAEMYRLCEEFLAYKSLNADSFAKKFYIIKEFDKSKLDNLFLTKIKELEEELKVCKTGYDLNIKRGDLENTIIQFHARKNNQHKMQYHILRRGEYCMNSILHWLGAHYSDLSGHESQYGKINEPNITGAFLSNINLLSFSGWLNENMRPHFTYTAILCNSLLMRLHKENELHYFKSKKLILDNFDLFDDDNKIGLIIMLHNYCVTKSPNILFKKERFELDKISLPFIKAYFFDFGIFLEPFYFLKTVVNALEVEELKWTEKFINDFTQYLLDDERERCRNLALALLAFEKSEFEESLKYLNQIRPTAPGFKVSFKLLILRVYYELDMIELGLSAIDSMYHFIYNTKELSDRVKQKLQSQINIMNDLYKLKIHPEKIDKITLLKLRDNIEKVREIGWITEKNWFLRKLKEIEKKIPSKKPYLKKTLATS